MNLITKEDIYYSYNDAKDKLLPEWFKDYLKHIGEKYTNVVNKEYTLIGMSETNEDYYYVGQDNKGNRVFESCVGKINFIK